jgi:hypothetical protein
LEHRLGISPKFNLATLKNGLKLWSFCQSLCKGPSQSNFTFKNK